MTKTERLKQIRQLGETTSHKNILSIFKDKCEIIGGGGGGNICVYGAGNVGKSFLNYFLDIFGDKEISYFLLDKNAFNGQTYLNYPVYKPDAVQLDWKFRKDALVIIAIFLDSEQYNEIIENLKEIGYTRFINAMPFFTRALFASQEINNENIISKEIDDISSAFELMTDEHSEDVFYSVFKAHATADYDMKALSSGMTTYVDVGVSFRFNYRSFIDCGAYTGDTLEELVKRYKVENYFGFEPDLHCYSKLSERVKTYYNKAKYYVLLPIGVSNKNEYLRFTSIGTGTSRINKTGDTIVQTVKLDDMLKGYDDLFIKMDIEGAEISALEGAKNIIVNTAPDLAISVYHKISDLWQIPLMLKEWVPEYRFYMRNHISCTIDTVLYATLE
jgi:FkbM family methyltransferase